MQLLQRVAPRRVASVLSRRDRDVRAQTIYARISICHFAVCLLLEMQHEGR